MNRIKIAILLISLLVVFGCNIQTQDIYEGKTLRVRASIGRGASSQIVTWTNVTDLSYSEDEEGYIFKSDGKLVVLVYTTDDAVIIEEE